MLSFLETLSGHTAVVVGGGEGIALAIRRRFSQVIAAHPDRFSNRGPITQLLKDGEILYACGRDATPDHLPHDCDLVVLAFLLANLDDPVKALTSWIPILKDHGRLAVLEWYGGPHEELTKDTRLHESLLTHFSEVSNFHCPDSREITRWMRNAGLVHVRHNVEEAKHFFTEDDTTLLVAESLARLVQYGEGESALARRLRKESFTPAPILVAKGLFKRVRDPGTIEDTDKSAESKSRTALAPPNLEARTLNALLSSILGDEVDSPIEISNRLLTTFGASALGSIRDPEKLMEAFDLPRNVSARLVDAIELGRRLFSPIARNKIQIFSPLDAYNYLKGEMATLKQEHFRGLYLNARGYLIADEVITIGILTSVLLHPREVFGHAIAHNCHSVLVAHNHPSGDPEPSPDDIHLTRGLAEAARFLQIELVDHIIIGEDSFVSMKERGYF